MIPMYRDLFRHQEWADNAILKAVAAHPPAAENEDMRKRLQHIVLVQRAFLSVFLARPFDVQKERHVAESMEEFERLYRETHAEELAFVDALAGADLARSITVPWFPNLQMELRQALMQVVMHSQGHRAQCATLLRKTGGEPPSLDYIWWLQVRTPA
jgi:uncharacterized damage-inducible protein DinB